MAVSAIHRRRHYHDMLDLCHACRVQSRSYPGCARHYCEHPYCSRTLNYYDCEYPCCRKSRCCFDCARDTTRANSLSLPGASSLQTQRPARHQREGDRCHYHHRLRGSHEHAMIGRCHHCPRRHDCQTTVAAHYLLSISLRTAGYGRKRVVSHDVHSDHPGGLLSH